ncbi:MAG TPA: glycosyltransferase [Promineifilum sp.]|nr:glycosyltransferase [Promineifilum sp.]
MTKGTVVIIAVVHWHFTWQSQHNMASEMARLGYRVLFIEPLPKRWPRISEFSRVLGRLSGNNIAAGLCQQPLVPGVELVSPHLLPDTGHITRGINRRVFVPTISNRLKQDLNRPLIIINYLPTSASLALMEALQPDASFYHCINDWSNDPYAPAHEFEERLATSVDMVWADSPVNIARTSRMSPNVVPLPHGVNIDLFRNAGHRPGISPKSPRCVYFGSIREGLDFDLLRAISHRFPLRLIGPVRASLNGFSKETEVVGPVPQEEIPKLLHDADVLLLPYAHTVHNKGIMPAKLFECLATGIPIVAAGLETVYDFADLIYIRETHDTFLDAIEESVREPEELQYKRIALAEQYSYARRTIKIESYINQALSHTLITSINHNQNIE